ncbi:hypothetical protein HanIR_Chr09g0446301 [Helianthus annuus]|nr:hypothetical protein HanIR_Chr09g0446301 [Helianthus annuus]
MSISVSDTEPIPIPPNTDPEFHPYRTDTENTKKWIPIGIPIGIGIGTVSVRDRYGIGIRWHMLIPSFH